MKYLIAALAGLAVAMPALAQLTDVHIAQQTRAKNACPALVARHDAAVTAGKVSSYYAEDCTCLADSITWEGWDEIYEEPTGEFMSEADAMLVADTLSSAATIDDAMTLIYESISLPGSAVLSNCFGK
ncbi:hypothetical protein HPO_11484 [Hyphomonas polymorpha PS728]|uniref:Lipoprotein n=1 Tax=Hyphomonas polymorpha PS728 TaxID=1280954 RepID=A0A062V7V0_9PROT|nr:hypothetical protein [Hyphomonas polymorpha]KCZ98222.1 hypothetical protein HPO_11484 [Hyphomonas polymorpha PS728]